MFLPGENVSLEDKITVVPRLSYNISIKGYFVVETFYLDTPYIDETKRSEFILVPMLGTGSLQYYVTVRSEEHSSPDTWI